jgi:hypothetical protein
MILDLQHAPATASLEPVWTDELQAYVPCRLDTPDELPGFEAIELRFPNEGTSSQGYAVHAERRKQFATWKVRAVAILAHNTPA